MIWHQRVVRLGEEEEEAAGTYLICWFQGKGLVVDGEGGLMIDVFSFLFRMERAGGRGR